MDHPHFAHLRGLSSGSRPCAARPFLIESKVVDGAIGQGDRLTVRHPETAGTNWRDIHDRGGRKPPSWPVVFLALSWSVAHWNIGAASTRPITRLFPRRSSRLANCTVDDVAVVSDGGICNESAGEGTRRSTFLLAGDQSWPLGT